jgi:hypothetical protein
MELRHNSKFNLTEASLIALIKNFSTSGNLFIEGKRNRIKLFEFEGNTLNIKSFKVPNLLNKIIYKHFRKSKAERSFEFANLLIERGIGTPEPIAFYQNFDAIGLKDSYYISEHLECDLTFRDLVEIPDFPENEIILRQFTRFSYDLHQKGIEFLDHSPGNTLIKKRNDGKYDFFLVDLNRMLFHKSMSFEVRIKNLCRLTPKKEMVAIMSNEYAKISGKSEQLIFQMLWKSTEDFQYNLARKKKIKKKLKFWKK